MTALSPDRMTRPWSSSWRRADVWVLVAVAATVAGTLLPRWIAQPLSMDDRVWFADAEVRRDLRSIFDPFVRTENPFRNSYYLPFQSCLFLLSVSSLGRVALRALVLLAHLGSALMVGALAWRLGPSDAREQDERREFALVSAALFALYPANLATACWLSAGVSHVLSTCLLLGAGLLFWEAASSTPPGRTWRALGALACGIGACGLRETGALLPIIAAGIAIARRRSIGAPGQMVAWLLPFVLVSLVTILIQVAIYPGGAVAQQWGGVIVARLPWRTLDLFTQIYLPVRQPLALKAVLVALTLGVAACIVVGVRRRPTASLLLLTSWLALVPFSISNLHPVFELRRYLYLPSVSALPLFVLLYQRVARFRWSSMAGVGRLLPRAILVTFALLDLLFGLRGIV